MVSTMRTLRFDRRVLHQLIVVFILGFSSGLPMALVGSTLQAWYASVGQSVLITGMLGLLSFPYAYRVLWAPLVDYYPLTLFGRRRSWLILTQLLLCIGFNLVAWYSPLSHPLLLASSMFVLALISATQDAVIDAHRTEYLTSDLYGIGASLATLGYRIAMLLSGGVALIMASRYGFTITYRIMGVLMLPGVIASLKSKEPRCHHPPENGVVETTLLALKALFLRKRIVSLLLFIFFYKLGEAFTTTAGGVTMPFLLQGIGFSLDTVGIVNKVIGVISIVLGGLLSGILLMRWSLYKALLTFGILQAITNLTFVALAFVGKSLPLLMCAVISDNFAAGMGSTAIVVLFMRLVDKRFTATQFSIFVSFATLPRIFSGPIAVILQSYVGWIGVFELSFIFALVFLPFLQLIRFMIGEASALEKDSIRINKIDASEGGAVELKKSH